MTGILYLDWPIIAVSLFNAILSLWLALTVLLNAERRNRGVYLAGAGLLASAAFFISHTAIVGWLFDPAGLGLDFWWHVGWLPIIVAPFGWYVLMLWYSGYWESAPLSTRGEGLGVRLNPLRRRHTVWLAVTVAMLIVLFGLALFTIPSFAQAMYFDFTAIPTLRGVPILLLLYPAFIVVCIALALDALIRPGPSHRVLGDLARARSRRWLVAASVDLLAVSLLVTAAILWGISAIIRGRPIILTPDFIVSVAWFDLAAATLIGITITLLGQSVVAYEVFTGTALPRRGFFRNWVGATLLAGAYGAVAGGTIVAHWRPIYGLLLSAVLMTVFYALFNWRSFVERDRFMQRLRPFVGGQGLIQQLAGAEREAHARAGAMFRALCAGVLGASQARLIPLGPLSTLITGLLAYPADSLPAVTLDNPGSLFNGPDQDLARLPLSMSPFRWAIPLLTQRGLIGALLLADKQDGGLYTQEEIEIARASGEGIIDMLAGEEIARRLMDIQRRRLAESQVMDRRARRALHDDVLPNLHAALLGISALPRDNPAVQQAVATLTNAHRQIADLIHSAAGAPAQLESGILLPDSVRRLTQAEFAAEFDEVAVTVEGPPRPLDPLTNEVVFYAIREAIRNAALHGRDKNRPLQLDVSFKYGDALTIVIADNGVGLHVAPSPAEVSSPLQGGGGRNPRLLRVTDGGGEPLRSPGAQGGLALHTTLLAVIGGSLAIGPRAGGGTCVTLRLPLPATTR